MKIIKAIFKIFTFLMLLGICSFLFMLYGPFEKPRALWITTAMSTFSHQYLATSFFPSSTIDKILSKNALKDENEQVDLKSIDIKDLDSATCFNSEELDIKDKNSSIEKVNSSYADYSSITPIEGKNFKGHLLTISDPSKVSVDITPTLNSRGIKIKDYIKSNKVLAAINGGGFKDDGGHGHGGTPLGVIIKDSKVIYAEEKSSYNFVGFNKDDIFVCGNYTLGEIKNMDIRDGVTYFCRLIVNGKPLIGEDTQGSGIQPRTAIGQTKDGKVLMLVIDGRQLHSIGATLKQVQDIMLKHGAYNAVNLDGGSSSVMYYTNQLVSSPSSQHGERFLPSMFIVE